MMQLLPLSMHLLNLQFRQSASIMTSWCWIWNIQMLFLRQATAKVQTIAS